MLSSRSHALLINRASPMTSIPRYLVLERGWYFHVFSLVRDSEKLVLWTCLANLSCEIRRQEGRTRKRYASQRRRVLAAARKISQRRTVILLILALVQALPVVIFADVHSSINNHVHRAVIKGWSTRIAHAQNGSSACFVFTL